VLLLNGLAGSASAQEFDLEDVTPGWLNMNVRDACIVGDYVYIASLRTGIQTYDISDPGNPVWVHNLNLNDEIWSVCVDGSRLYAANDEGSCSIIDISTPNFPVFVSNFDHSGGDRTNLVHAKGDYVYFKCCTYPLMVYNVADPQNVFLVDTPINESCFGTDYVLGDTIYFTNEERLFVVDISSPDEGFEYSVHNIPTINGANLLFEPDYIYVAHFENGLTILENNPDAGFPVMSSISAETIPSRQIFTKYGDTLYIVGARVGMIEVDVSDPHAPEITDVLPLDSPFPTLAQSGNIVISRSSGYDAWIVDLSNFPFTENYVEIPALSYPAECLVKDGYVFVADGDIKVIRLDENLEGEIVSIINTPQSTYSLEFFHDNYLLAPTSYSGVDIYDISNPGTPDLVARVELEGEVTNLCIFHDYVLVDCRNYGVKVIDLSDIFAPEVLDTRSSGIFSHPNAMEQSEGILYASFYGCIKLIDIIDPGNPVIYKTYEYGADDIFFDGELLYVPTRDQRFLIINPDLDMPGAVLAELPLEVGAQGIFVEDGFVYLLNYLSQMSILDIRDFENIHEVASIQLPRDARDIYIDGNFAYVSCSPGGMRIIRLR